jgi:hypothetical protein
MLFDRLMADEKDIVGVETLVDQGQEQSQRSATLLLLLGAIQ